MKKLAILAVVGALGATVALGFSVNIPFFLDNAPADGSFPPSSGTASYFAIHNNTGSSIVCTVTYTTDAGLARTPANNTFVLPAQTSFSFRPVAQDSTTEGPSLAVPAMTQVSGDFAVGSATISWTGGTAADIQGRASVTRSTTSGGDSYGFLLPPGQ